MSRTGLQFPDAVRRENIKSLSWYLLRKYLESESECPVLLNVLTEYVKECEVPADSYVFVKVLNLLLLSRQVEVEDDDGNNVAVVRNIYDTILGLKAHCTKELENLQKSVDQLLSEARCQVIVSHLMYDDIPSALLHWKEFYTDENLADDPLGSQLKRILTYLSEDSYRKKRDEEMNLSINLFFTDHKLEVLRRVVQDFVRDCCVNVLGGIKTIKYNLRSASHQHYTRAQKSSGAITSDSTGTSRDVTSPVARERGKRKVATSSDQAKKSGRKGHSTVGEHVQKTLTETGRIRESPAETGRVRASPAKTRRVRESPAETGQVRESPAETGRVRESSAETGQVRESPAETERVRELPAKTRRVRESPAETGRVRESPAETGRVIESPAETGRVRESPAKTRRVRKSPATRRRVRESPTEKGQVGESPAETGQGSGMECEVIITRTVPAKGTSEEEDTSSPPTKRRMLTRNAKAKTNKNVAAALRQYDFSSSSDDDEEEGKKSEAEERVGSVRDVTVETTPTSRLPARLTPVHFKRTYMDAGSSSSSNTQSSRSWAGFRGPRKKKVKFSVQETEYLTAGIKRYGYGNWAVILSKYPFHPSRDKVSLKDKARNLRGRY